MSRRIPRKQRQIKAAGRFAPAGERSPHKGSGGRTRKVGPAKPAKEYEMYIEAFGPFLIAERRKDEGNKEKKP